MIARNLVKKDYLDKSSEKDNGGGSSFEINTLNQCTVCSHREYGTSDSIKTSYSRLPLSSSELAIKPALDECSEASLSGEEQLLTNTQAVETQNTFLDQTDDIKNSRLPVCITHKIVKQATHRGSARKPLVRSGGHKTTRYLTHEEWRQAKSNAYVIVNAGFRWTIFVSIHPSVNLSDSKKQKRIQLILARLGQALNRRGVPYICMRTYEKPVGGSLHGHALIHVPQEHFDVIERLADRFDRHARKKLDKDISVETHARVIGNTHDDLRRAILYPLKQHRWAGPGCDGAGSTRKFWEKGEPIKGRRISYSTQAKAILIDYVTTLSTAVFVNPIVNPETITQPIQLSFGHDWISFDVRALTEQTRIERGMTQTEAGTLIGYRQPGYNNAIVRRHDPLSLWARNRAIEFIRLSRAA